MREEGKYDGIRCREGGVGRMKNEVENKKKEVKQRMTSRVPRRSCRAVRGEMERKKMAQK
jgi:hypothetical protein